ncbi:MAG: FAD-binding protein [Bacteroidaceae bacterium]|nr:FAD-binding protein [Bacteroidaceae bacterium]
MIKEIQIRVEPQFAYNEQVLRETVARQCAIDARTINAVRVLKKSIDARQRTIFVNLSLRIFINEQPTDDGFTHIEYPDVSQKPAVIVVGAGPGGLFAALKLIELGLRPIVLERGKNVRERKIDIADITRSHKINPESNYSFGEGGAGAYSDGKLYTRSKKRGNTERILNIFCQHGASTAILSDAHPHIGTDKLPRVIENMRNTIISSGGEVHFGTKMTGFIINGNKVIGAEAVQNNTELTFMGPVILATGHSARDTYRYLHSANIAIEAKSLAVGTRLEHPSELIDRLQYHNKNGRGKYLPAAEYNFVTQVDGRGVYSFCMCPGGFVVPAASGPEQIVVNGMSPSGRNSKWSNSGMVVETRVEDIATNEDELKDPLLMMRFQEKIERDCWIAGNMRQTAPAQRMTDFVNGKLSYDLPSTSYSPGLISSPLHFWMPEFIVKRMQQGFQVFGRSCKGFLSSTATLIAAETRTSSPVRITRNNETLQHITMNGLFPCGEGAGYAGGIVSSAVDGERCAEAAFNYLNSHT